WNPAALPLPGRIRQIGNLVQLSSRRCGGTAERRHGGRFLRLHETPPSWHDRGGGAAGRGPVPVATARAAATFPARDSDAGWRRCRTARHGHHYCPAATACFGPSHSFARSGSAGPTFDRSYSPVLAG